MTFQTIRNNSKMGLNNTICKNPYAFCKSKQVYLSKSDVKSKQCLNKPTLDMIGEIICHNLKIITESEVI